MKKERNTVVETVGASSPTAASADMLKPTVFSDLPTLCVDVVIKEGDWSRLADIAQLVATSVDALAKCAGVSGKKHFATLALSNDEHVASLNKTYRGKEAPTNVLSFPNVAEVGPESPTGAPEYLGDVVMAVETLEREADELDIPLDHHFRHLLVHGLLHLYGFDHETDKDADQMEALEISVLGELGVPDPYKT